MFFIFSQISMPDMLRKRKYVCSGCGKVEEVRAYVHPRGWASARCLPSVESPITGFEYYICSPGCVDAALAKMRERLMDDFNKEIEGVQ